MNEHQDSAGRRRHRRDRDFSSTPGLSAGAFEVVVPYDPLDYDNLARSCVLELLSQAVRPLPPLQAFRGYGVYALFYVGEFEPYRAVRNTDPDAPTHPIYVGKADAAGGRKGARSPSAAVRSELYWRLVDHAVSIRAVQNLRVEDFRCRFLVVEPLWIRMVERFLIEATRPIWNGCLDGFGLHDPGAGRAPLVSWWDAMHPGRPSNLSWKATIRFDRTIADAELRLSHWMTSSDHPVDVDDTE